MTYPNQTIMNIGNMNIGDSISLFKRMHPPIENLDKTLPINTQEFSDSCLRVFKTIGLKPMKQYLFNHNITIQQIVENAYSFQQILRMYDTPIINIKKKNRFFNLTNCMSVIVGTSILDILIVAIVLGSKHHVPYPLLIARGSAVLILTQLIYIFVPLSSFVDNLPDKVIHHIIPSCNQKKYHIVFGIKMFIACLIHTIGHLIQIERVLQKCKLGCSFNEVLIVRKHDSTVSISRTYFFGSYPYFTGIILTGLVFIMIFVILFKSKLRFITGTIIHKYCGLLIMIGVILHGVQQLIGFNISYVLTLPILLGYMAKTYRMILPINRLTISAHRWNISKTAIHLYLKESPTFVKYLEKNTYSTGILFNMVSIYLKCPRINNEWHPFTLIRHREYSSLMIKVSGEWTENLKNILTHSMITRLPFVVGVCNKSKFRFVLFYNVQMHVCAGVGITACMSALSYMKLNKKADTEVIIYWSISDVSIIQELAYELLQIIDNMNHVKLHIFYSNSKLFNPANIPDHEKLRFLYLQSLVYKNNRIDLLSGVELPTPIKIGRLNLGQELYKFIDKYDFPVKIGVFICASSQYAKHIECEIESIETRNVGFDVWSECV